jgi:hypothetical protein
MDIRLHGLPEECTHAAALLARTPGLTVVGQRGPYQDRPPSDLVRVYLTTRLATPPSTAGATATTAEVPRRAARSPRPRTTRGGERW